jgi:hypothetical protein
MIRDIATFLSARKTTISPPSNAYSSKRRQKGENEEQRGQGMGRRAYPL